MPPFSLLDESAETQEKERKKESPELVAIKYAMTSLSPGEMSDFLPLDDSGLIAVLEKRERRHRRSGLTICSMPREREGHVRISLQAVASFFNAMNVHVADSKSTKPNSSKAFGAPTSSTKAVKKKITAARAHTVQRIRSVNP